jgi:starvation-inducible DNA-binding protein
MNGTIMLNQEIREQVTQTLRQLLSDTYVIYLKTQNFHWNLIDPRFYFLHLLFEDEYKQLAEAVDEIAERIRILGEKTPASMKKFLEMTTLEESGSDVTADDMIKQLYEDHEKIASQIRGQIAPTQKIGDEGTADLLIDRLRYHEKTAWILCSHINDYE